METTVLDTIDYETPVPFGIIKNCARIARRQHDSFRLHCF